VGSGRMRFKYSSLYWWWRLINHSWFRFDDRHIPREFWYSINAGYYEMNREHYWGKNYQPEVITLSERDFDSLIERLNTPVSQEVKDRFREILNKPSPWKDE
jgi:hypothetical protein